MNKEEFLAELKRRLNSLSDEERNDILRDMEEYFYEAKSRGLSEQEVTAKLGSPKKLAETIVAEAKVKRINTASTIPGKISAFFAALFAIILLTPFNLIFVLIPLFLVTLLILISWPIALLLMISLPIVLIILLATAIHVGLKLFALLAILFFGIGWFGMTFAVMFGLAYVTYLFFKGVAKLFMWNINFIKNRMRG